jgi:antitoxin CcdA
MRMVRHLSDPPRPFRGAPLQTRTEKQYRKRAVNVSIDEEILMQAKASGLNLSQTLEDALRAALREKQIKEFKEKNREAIESYNRFVAKHGLWGQEYRKW